MFKEFKLHEIRRSIVFLLSIPILATCTCIACSSATQKFFSRAVDASQVSKVEIVKENPDLDVHVISIDGHGIGNKSPNYNAVTFYLKPGTHRVTISAAIIPKKTSSTNTQESDSSSSRTTKTVSLNFSINTNKQVFDAKPQENYRFTAKTILINDSETVSIDFYALPK
jgi:hypothetical protein